MTATIARRFYFISGLPRSGSTLLSAILQQNPRFHCGVTSPLAGLVISVLNQVSLGSEFGPQISTSRRRNLLRGLFASYYSDVEQEVVFDIPTLLDATLELCEAAGHA